MPFLFPLTLLLLPRRATWRDGALFYGVAIGVAAAITIPLALWNTPAFLWNVGLAQWYQVFRLDALSYLALYARMFGQQPSQLIGFMALVVALFFCWRYASRTPEGFASAMALSLSVFFAFNKQAFANYYFLVIGVLCCAFASMPLQAVDRSALGTPRHFWRRKSKAQLRAATTDGTA